MYMVMKAELRKEQYMAPFAEELCVALDAIIATSNSLEDPQDGGYFDWVNLI